MSAGRAGVFGGTFDPPHLGHIMACLWALESGEVDRVILVPVGSHAFGKAPLASFEHRVTMCRIAVTRFGSAAEVSDIEGQRPGVSYMIDTLRTFKEQRPDEELRLLTGTDVAREVEKWKEPAEVLRLAPLLEIPRPLAGESFADRPGALPPISSTDVRAALAGRLPVNHFLSWPVREYIRKQGLYAAG